MTLNWTKANLKKAIKNKSPFFTAYIGNLDLNAKESELFEFFKNNFHSVISCKIIYDLQVGISKGYGFVDLTDIDEYNQLIKNENPLFFFGKKLFIK